MSYFAGDAQDSYVHWSILVLLDYVEAVREAADGHVASHDRTRLL